MLSVSFLKSSCTFVALPSEALRRRFIFIFGKRELRRLFQKQQTERRGEQFASDVRQERQGLFRELFDDFFFLLLDRRVPNLGGSRDFCHARRQEAVRHAPQRGREKRAQQRK
jgi:hypothetical protein